jgi:hypothetical protein
LKPSGYDRCSKASATPFPLEEHGSFLALSKAFTHTFCLYSYGGKGVRYLKTMQIKQIVLSNLTDEEIRNQLDELEKTRSRLLEVGLLDKIGSSDFLIKPQDII